MKKILIALLLIIITGLNSSAQLTKGTFLLGGTASFTSGNYTTAFGLEKHKTSTLFVSPEAGYFVLPKLVAGLRIQFSDDRDKTVENLGSGGLPNNKTKSLNISPFARYYLLSQTNKLMNCFVEGSYGFGNLNEYPTHIFSIVAGPEIYFNSNVGLEFTIGYYKSYSTIYNVTTTGFQAGLGFQIHLGKDNP